jgi:ABC-type branched-subunit amino acid transport system permease subunit
LLLAGLITVPVGALVAIPAIRLSGLYLALATLGFGVLMQDVIFPTYWMFGSKLSVSARRPHLGPFNGANDKHFYYLVLGLAVACVLVMTVISRSRLGRLLKAMAETPTMLATHGLGVNMTRLIVFCISAFFAGSAGALVVTQFGSASGVGYGPMQSLIFLAVLAICGTRLVRSSILAAGLLAIVPGYMSKFDVDRQTFAFGVLAIAAGIVIAKRSEIMAFLNQATATKGRPAVRRRTPASRSTTVADRPRLPAGVSQ